MLKYYSRLARSNDLAVVSPDDEFYSSTLALPRVRYVFLDPGGTVARYAPPYVYLGITLTAGQALHLSASGETFRQRLRQWGLDSTEPIGTVITATTLEELLRFIRSARQSDLYLPEDLWRQAHIEDSHAPDTIADGGVLALAKISPVKAGWSATRMPDRW
jgi:hypothetical protein